MEFDSMDVSYPKFIEDEDPPCAETDPEMFFSEEISETYNAISGNYNVHSRYYNADGARAVCKSCPLIEACLNYALSDYTIQGIWGGTTEHDRRIMRDKLKAKKNRRI